jgi:hypothetical protein
VDVAAGLAVGVAFDQEFELAGLVFLGGRC